MKHLTTLLLSGLLLASGSVAQLTAQGDPPADDAPICPIPMATDHDQGFDDVGLAAGIAAPDFTLFDLAGTRMNLYETLAEGKPVLLVNGSYTCPVFRGKIPTINRVQQEYGERIAVFVIYTVEAHPVIDTSVYFGRPNTGSANQREGILYRQPTTYGERKEVVGDLLATDPIDVPVLIDGPCNDWWTTWGYAPNNAYLIDTTGVITAKHGWFDRSPHDVDDDIRGLLGEEVEEDDTLFGDRFDFELTSTRVVTGQPGEVIYLNGVISNPGSRPVVIDIIRREDRKPEGWETALCVDVCYASWVDSIQVVVEPGEVQDFTFYFYTGTTADTGRATVTLRNAANRENRYRESIGGITSEISSVEEYRHSPALQLDLSLLHPGRMPEE